MAHAATNGMRPAVHAAAAQMCIMRTRCAHACGAGLTSSESAGSLYSTLVVLCFTTSTACAVGCAAADTLWRTIQNPGASQMSSCAARLSRPLSDCVQVQEGMQGRARTGASPVWARSPYIWWASPVLAAASAATRANKGNEQPAGVCEPCRSGITRIQDADGCHKVARALHWSFE
jgi:hypothetical protein